jgi:hypothetical protein
MKRAIAQRTLIVCFQSSRGDGVLHNHRQYIIRQRIEYIFFARVHQTTMALLMCAAVAGGAWLYTAKTIDMKEKLNAEHERMTQDHTQQLPWQGVYVPFGKVVHSPDVLRGNFTSVQEGIDEQGAPVFYVDYANKSRVIQYHDPRIQL